MPSSAEIVSPESGAWNTVRAGWKQLYGGFHAIGFSIEWHEFQCAEPLDWGRSFHTEGLELCLNVAGHGRVANASQEANYRPGTFGYYAPAKDRIEAERHSQQSHAFLTVEFSREFLETQLAPYQEHLVPQVRQTVRGTKKKTSFLSPTRTLTATEQSLLVALREPPVAPAARPLWYQSKALELLAGGVFQMPAVEENFCTRQKRVARERVEHVIAILRRNLAEPPSLEALGKETGCSPFYLSRLFSSETGVTIPQYLRKVRMERAAELLRSGKFNVTEAALEVGYNSLSHFSKAFCDTFGCCPCFYPHGAKAKV
jgi:AraC family transcriptional regulator